MADMSLKIESFTNWAIGLPMLLQTSTVVGFLLLGYIVYYRYLHPLAKYPGPPLASLTNLWKTYNLWNLHLPHTLVRLHEQYGEVVRVGPNDLSFRNPDAVNTIYKAGRQLQKTGFYDGFTAFNPNLFGTQDEEIHAIRRRQMAHAFSLQSIKEMEHFVDSHILKLRKSLDNFCDTNQEFDLKDMIAFYVFDVLGELAFSRSFDSQNERDVSRLPPINDHIYLACLMGMTPEALPWIKKVLPFIPNRWIKRLLNARAQLRDLTAACVRQRIEAGTSDRKDLLSSLLAAVDSETGSKLTELDINTEAFAMVVAGSHTTSGTLTLLFSHLLKNTEMLNKNQPSVHHAIASEDYDSGWIHDPGTTSTSEGALGTIAGATAECFATAGASLFLSDIQPALPDFTKDRLLHLGADAVHYHRCDVGNPNECEELVKQAISTVGDIDVLINGAGVVGIRVFHKQDPALFLRDMAINFNGPLVLMRLVLPGFIERRRGCVINIASKAATVDFPFNISYCTSKAALIKLTSVLQAEVDEVAPSSDINLYAIHPGAVRSGMKTADGHQDSALGEFPQIMGRFEEWMRRFTGSPHLAGMSCVALATGIAKDALRGRYYDVEQDLEDIIAQVALLKEDPLLHRLNISMLGALEREEGAIDQEPEERFDFPGF
nr:hypothetical protein FVER53263_12478 [Fusarium verticillioides]